jgi:hypothetical protein
MAKISTYPSDSNITGSDRLIGTDADDMNATKNFSVSSLAAYVNSPVTLQFVLDNNNTATQDINLNGDINLVNLSVSGLLEDFFGNPGTINQILTSTGTGIKWEDVSSLVTLQSVLDSNNTATQDINLNGNIDLVNLSVSGVVNDFFGNAGTLGQVLTSTVTGVKWENQYSNYYGSFYSDVVQIAPAAATAVTMTYNNTDFASGISIVSGSIIKIANAGKYNIQFSAQLHDTSGGSSKMDIWLRKNGVNVPNTNTKVVVEANHYEVAAWNFFVDAIANDEYEIMWATSDLDLIIDYAPATVLAPATPSVILTVNRIG